MNRHLENLRTVETRLSTAESDIDTAQSDISDLDTDLAAAESAIDALEAAPSTVTVTDYNSWDDYGGSWTFKCTQDYWGYVTMEGLYRNNNGVAATSTAFNNIFLLPSGARPAKNLVHSCMTSTGAAQRIDILPAGNVTINTGVSTSIPSGGWVSMLGVRFLAV